MKYDPVNNPIHYCSHPSQIQAINICENMNFCVGNAFKYLYRCDKKGKTLQDIDKAIWYVEREVRRRLNAVPFILRGLFSPPESYNVLLDGDGLIIRIIRSDHRFSGHAAAALGHLWTASKYPRSAVPLESALRSLRACRRIQQYKEDSAV